MLEKALEFIRIVDPLPADEKVRNRKESAQILLDQVRQDERAVLDLVQGVVGGFVSSPFSQESPIIDGLIKAVKAKDETMPFDLSENAVELRALAAIAVGEAVISRNDGRPTGLSILIATALMSGLPFRPPVHEKHLKSMLGTLVSAATETIALAA